MASDHHVVLLLEAAETERQREKQKERNQKKFVATAKDHQHAERILQLLIETLPFPSDRKQPITNAIAATRLLLLLDPQLPIGERFSLERTVTAVPHQPATVIATGAPWPFEQELEDACQEIKVLEEQLEQHKAGVSNLKYLYEQLHVHLDIDASKRQIHDEMRRRGFTTTRAGRPPKDPSLLGHGPQVHLADQLLTKWDEESQEILHKSVLDTVQLCCSNHRCYRHPQFREMCMGCDDGHMVEEVGKEAVSKDREELDGQMTVRNALHATLKCSISHQKWEWLLKICGKTRKWPGKQAVKEEGIAMNEEVDELFDITNNLPNGWTGATVDVDKAIKAHLTKWLADHPHLLHLLPKTIKVRYTLDGTNMANQSRTMVVVCAILDLPGISDQSSDSCIPIAVLESSESRQMFVETLDQCFQYIASSQITGTNFHGQRKLEWKQSYDLSAWWKILELAGVQGEGDYCIFCECNRSNDFDFDQWRDVEIGAVWRHGANCIVSISPLHSGFCILHCKLRIIGDTLVQKLCWYAVDNRCKEALVGYMQEHIAENFKINMTTKKSSSRDETTKLECSSLIGNKCDKFVSEQHFPEICNIAGLSNQEREISDSFDGVATQCRAIKDDGCRCTKNKLNIGNFCQQHQNMVADNNSPSLTTSFTSNPQITLVTTHHLDEILELAAMWRLFYPALKSNIDFYTNDVYVETKSLKRDPCRILRLREEQVEYTEHQEGIPENLRMLDFGSDCDYDSSSDNDFYDVMTHTKSNLSGTAKVIDPEHPHCGHDYPVICVVDKDDKATEIEKAVERFGELWLGLFGEHSVTCYVHILCCHSIKLLKIHKNLGQFSNSGLESFHKVIKWMLNKTNRWGGNHDIHISLDLLRNYYKLLVLEVEFSEDVHAIATLKDGWVCPCENGGNCVYGGETCSNNIPAKRQRKVLDDSMLPTPSIQMEE